MAKAKSLILIVVPQAEQTKLEQRGMERRAIALARACAHHIKNTYVLCRMPKTLYGILSQIFPIYSFFALLIILFLVRVRINFAKLYRKNVYDKNLLVLASSERPYDRSVIWLNLMGIKTLYFWILYIAGKCNFQCKSGYLEAPKQIHLRMKNVSRTRNT